MDRAIRKDPARVVFGAIAAVCAASLAVALFAQHALDLQPCAWCILQRMIVIAIGVLALGAFWARGWPATGGRRVASALLGAGTLVLATLGLVAAYHQHTVAAKSLSCAFTWADRFLMSVALDQWWPWMFRVGATCADAALARLLGLPVEYWSGALFLLTGGAVVALVLVLLTPGRRPA